MTVSTLALVIGLGATIACSRDRDQPKNILAGDATVTAAGLVVANDDAVARLVSARCGRKLSCGNPGKRPSAEEAQRCQDQVRPEMRSRLQADVCPLGVDRSQLDECVREIENADCNNPLDTFERYVHCRRVELCPRVAE